MKLHIDLASGRLVGPLPEPVRPPRMQAEMIVWLSVITFAGVPIAARMEVERSEPFIEVETEVVG